MKASTIVLTIIFNIFASHIFAQKSNIPDFLCYRDMHSLVQLRDYLNYPHEKLDARSSCYKLSPEVKIVNFREAIRIEFDEKGRFAVYENLEIIYSKKVFSYTFDDKSKETEATIMSVYDDGNSSQYATEWVIRYNQSGYMTSQKESNGFTLSWSYLPDNKLTYYKEGNNDFYIEYKYNYLADGSVELETVNNAVRRSMVFDKYGLMKSCDVFENGEKTESRKYNMEYSYYKNGAIASIKQYKDGKILQSWSFHKNGNFSEIAEYIDDVKTKIETFNKAGLILTEENNYSPQAKEVITYVYDKNNLKQSVITNGNAENFSYDKYGNPLDGTTKYEYFK
ncbi:MAG: hypothetical protein KBT32_01270 [Bacteroidales bacterium]|nr:hypothetical protein [Candidatus Physcocola equi]